MTPEEHKRHYELIQNPPPGSKLEAAKQYGVDLTLALRSLALTPAERVLEMEGALRFVEDLQRAAQQVRAAGRPKDLNALPELEALKELEDSRHPKE